MRRVGQSDTSHVPVPSTASFERFLPALMRICLAHAVPLREINLHAVRNQRIGSPDMCSRGPVGSARPCLSLRKRGITADEVSVRA